MVDHMRQGLLFLMAFWAAGVLDRFTGPLSHHSGREEVCILSANRYSLKEVYFPPRIQWLLAGCSDTHWTVLPWSLALFHLV